MTDSKLILTGDSRLFPTAVTIYLKKDWVGKKNGWVGGYRSGENKFTVIVNKKSITIYCYKENTNG